MIADPAARGQALADFHFGVAPALYSDLVESGMVPESVNATRARLEWDCLALYACVRGLVAAGGFNTETAASVDSLHAAVLERWAADSSPSEPIEARRARVAERYAEYGRIGQELEASGAALVTARLGEACAAHVTAPDVPPAALGETLGALHEALVEGATEAVRRGRAAAVTPPIEPLLALTRRLDDAGIRWALGGSGLLAALGLVDVVNDWDVTCDADVETLEALFADVEHSSHGNDALHADHKLTFPEERAELIARFAFFVPGGVVRVPVLVSREWRGLPVGSPEAWAAAYALLGEGEDSGRRRDRSERLFRWLRREGAAGEAIEALLAEPLPAALADRLRALRRT